MLPFDWGELRRYGWGFASLRLVLLRWIQARTFRKADGVIFLTRHAQNMVTRTVRIDGRTAIIPHGVDGRFVHAPRDQLSINEYSEQKPYRILYVSSIDVYKHQWRAAEAIAQLRGMGVPVVLDLVGPAHAIPFRWLTETLDRVDPGRAFVRYLGKVSYAELHEHYLRADLFMFASSCETMPNILLEGMASGLPIACSDRGPMPEVLGDAGVYFDPEDAKSIQEALNRLIRSPELRTEKAHAAFEKVGAYSWRRCADEAFRFLADVARNA
jgi:glycosyltransferase involved in cell wall biosynthesis